jgi:hypothetical protein
MQTTNFLRPRLNKQAVFAFGDGTVTGSRKRNDVQRIAIEQ